MYKDFTEFDAMSTDVLREVLLRDSRMPAGEGYGTDAILYIMQVLARREPEYPSVDEAWRVFNECYRSDDCDGTSLYDE